MSDKKKQDKTQPKSEKAKEAKLKTDAKKETLKTLKGTEGTEKSNTETLKKTEGTKKSSVSSESSVRSVLQKAHPKLDKIIEEIGTLSVLELADLVKALEKKFGVVAAAPVAAPASAPVQATTQAPQAEEKSEFDVVLAAVGANKIAAIKAVREIKLDIGLKEAKDLVEAAPGQVLKRADKKTAEEAKKKLEAAGCQVELK